MPAKLSCPYCYREIRDGTLWFLCAGRGSAREAGCRPETDEARARMTGFNEPARPAFPPPAGGLSTVRQAACPRCFGVTGFRACPNCHTPLSPNFGAAHSPLIALVGAIGTGKTVYLTVLANELRSNLRRRFKADVRLTGDGQGGFRTSLQWLQNNVERLYQKGELAPLTQSAPDGRRNPLVFEWRQEHQRRFRLPPRYRSSFLSFYDTAGEDLRTQTVTFDQAYIGAADAIIVLLDPFLIPAARDQIRLPDSAIKSEDATIDVLGRVTDQLRANHPVSTSARIPVPVAVAFAKMDAFFDVLGPDHVLRRVPDPGARYDEALGRTTHQAVRSLLDKWQADEIDDHLRINYTTYRFFAVSALGAQPDYENSMVSRVSPHRVDEPLLWLLAHFGVIPTGGSGS